MLQLCTSQNITSTPYTFRGTGIRVYSLEEALYHAYHYWRDSVDEFLSENLTAWIADLGLIHISAKMNEMANIEPLSKRLPAFLGIIEYFSRSELRAIKTDLERWEHRVEWEKLKDRADHLVSKGEPAKALPLYHRALKYEEHENVSANIDATHSSHQGLSKNAAILNNLAIANMQLANYAEAADLLLKAQVIQPDNIAITLHYTEAAILSGDYESAKIALKRAKDINLHDDLLLQPASSHTDKPLQSVEIGADILFLHGLAAYQQQDYPAALDYFRQAQSQNPDIAHYVHKIADTYVQLHQHDKALAALEQCGPHHVKMAEIYASYGHAHMPEAIRHLRKAISEPGQNEAAIWTKLAEYYRRDYDWQRANEAITHAIPSKSDAALLENARIKKGLGRMREYRAGISEALKGIKERYRTP